MAKPKEIQRIPQLLRYRGDRTFGGKLHSTEREASAYVLSSAVADLPESVSDTGMAVEAAS